MPVPSDSVGALYFEVSHAGDQSTDSQFYNFEQEEVIIGRDAEVDVTLADSAVSLVHARVLRQRTGVWVLDLGSTNGTWVDAERLVPQQPYPLGVGSRLTIGPFELIRRALGDSAATEAAPTAANEPAATTPQPAPVVRDPIGTPRPMTSARAGPPSDQDDELPDKGRLGAEGAGTGDVLLAAVGIAVLVLSALLIAYLLR